LGAHGIFDHIVHFYHLCALDWVDIVSALKADPKATADLAQQLSAWPKNSRHEMKAAQDRLKTFVNSGQLGVYASGYWGHKAMKLPFSAAKHLTFKISRWAVLPIPLTLTVNPP